MRTWLFLAAFVAASLRVPEARAQVPASGSFTARDACPATQSIHGPSPDAIALEPGRSYRLVGKNKPDATFLQIVVSGARRWVDVRCGATDAASAPSTSKASYVLALGWEPGFCRDHADTAECRRPLPARSLSLHGLWPEPRGRAYCAGDPALVQADRAHDWNRLPEPAMGGATRQRLAAVMPGVESGLERHEWVAHGTCSGLSADAYFNRAAELTEQVDASGAPSVFTGSVGGPLAADAIRVAFDQAFGSGAGARVTIVCVGRSGARRVTELRLALAGDVGGAAPISALIHAAAPVPPSCPGGLVDAPGQ